MKNLIVLSSPSGGGKTTIAKHIMTLYPNIKFSISATTRQARKGERNSIDYFFLSKDEFSNKIKENKLIEYEEIFGNFYGTLKSEAENAIKNNEIKLFDIDVKGAMSVKKIYGDNAILLFIAPPNLDVLEKRLRSRSTETEEQINTRLKRAELEMSYSENFDHIIINDILDDALNEVKSLLEKYLN